MANHASGDGRVAAPYEPYACLLSAKLRMDRAQLLVFPAAALLDLIGTMQESARCRDELEGLFEASALGRPPTFVSCLKNCADATAGSDGRQEGQPFIQLSALLFRVGLLRQTPGMFGSVAVERLWPHIRPAMQVDIAGPVLAGAVLEPAGSDAWRWIQLVGDLRGTRALLAFPMLRGIGRTRRAVRSRASVQRRSPDA